MADVRDLWRRADLIDVEDHWEEIRERTPRQGPPRTRHRWGTVAISLVVAALAISLVISAFIARPARRPSPAETATTRAGLIAYAGGNAAGPQIIVIRPDGTERRALTRDTGGSPSDPWPAWDPAWSPDGTKIAFRGYWGGGCDGCYDLYVMNADGSNVTRLTYGANADTPAWSPDGKQIAFTNWAGVWLINADGAELHRIIPPGTKGQLNASHVTWSPDGSRIAYAGGSGKYTQIFEANADGSDVRQVTHARFGAWGPSWSPDGSQIVFQASTSQQGAHDQLYVMGSDGSAPHPLLPCRGRCNDTSPSWSPGGQLIVFACERALCTVRPDGTGLRRIMTSDTVEEPVWQPVTGIEPSPAARDAVAYEAPFIAGGPGWYTHSSGPVLREDASFAWASTKRIKASDVHGGAAIPRATIAGLPEDGIVITAESTPWSFDPSHGPYPEGVGPFDLRTATVRRPKAEEPPGNYAVYEMTRHTVLVRVYFGSPSPSSAVLVRAQAELDTLQPPPVCPAPTSGGFEATLGRDEATPGAEVGISGPMPFAREDGSFDTNASTVMVAWWNAAPKDWPYLSSFSTTRPSPSVSGSPLIRLGQGGRGACSFSISFAVPDVPAGSYPIVVIEEGGGGSAMVSSFVLHVSMNG